MFFTGHTFLYTYIDLMANEPERLYREWPAMGDGGECIHSETETPPISKNCNRVKEAIKSKRKFIIKEMMKQDSNTSVHLLNENIRNLEWLMITWESIHYNPPVKWNKDWLNNLAPNVYRIFKKKSYAVHWKNCQYDLSSHTDFPPLCGTSDNINIAQQEQNNLGEKMIYSQAVFAKAISISDNDSVYLDLEIQKEEIITSVPNQWNDNNDGTAFANKEKENEAIEAINSQSEDIILAQKTPEIVHDNNKIVVNPPMTGNYINSNDIEVEGTCQKRSDSEASQDKDHYSKRQKNSSGAENFNSKLELNETEKVMDDANQNETVDLNIMNQTLAEVNNGVCDRQSTIEIGSDALIQKGNLEEVG